MWESVRRQVMCVNANHALHVRGWKTLKRVINRIPLCRLQPIAGDSGCAGYRLRYRRTWGEVEHSHEMTAEWPSHFGFNRAPQAPSTLQLDAVCCIRVHVAATTTAAAHASDYDARGSGAGHRCADASHRCADTCHCWDGAIGSWLELDGMQTHVMRMHYPAVFVVAGTASLLVHRAESLLRW
jgi:hypothetical protein